MFELTTKDPKKIIVEDRAREQFGDLSELTDDIKRVGLLYPILINEHDRLLDGGRRIAVYLKEGWDSIPCRVLPGLEPDDMIFIEWIGNRRKDFEWHEELSLKYKLHLYWCEKNSNWSYRMSAEKMGCSLGGLSTDLTLAIAMETFPALKEASTKGKAKDAYKKLQSSAQAAQAVDNLSEDEKLRLEAMLNGNGTFHGDPAKQDDGSSDLDFSEEDLNDPEVLAAIKARLTSEESAPPEAVPTAEVSLPKFSYEICGYKDLMAKIPADTVGFVELDPPYAINFESVYGQMQDHKSSEADWTFEQLQEAIHFLLPELYDKMLDRSWMVIWSGHEHAEWQNAYALKCGFSIQKPCIWKKPSGASNSPSTTAVSNYETMLLLRKGHATFNTNSFPAAFDCDNVPASKKVHQWEKNIEMYRMLFKSMAKPGSLFVSPFAGSGNSMIMATLFNMTPVGCDTNKKHFYPFYQKLKDYHLEE